MNAVDFLHPKIGPMNLMLFPIKLYHAESQSEMLSVPTWLLSVLIGFIDAESTTSFLYHTHTNGNKTWFLFFQNLQT